MIDAPHLFQRVLNIATEVDGKRADFDQVR